jgi:hypothetical protein
MVRALEDIGTYSCIRRKITNLRYFSTYSSFIYIGFIGCEDLVRLAFAELGLILSSVKKQFQSEHRVWSVNSSVAVHRERL